MNPEEKFKEGVAPILDKLTKSPTFAMSLGAKELFHTNFLAFLLETTDESIEAVTQHLKKRFFGDEFEGDVLVFREKTNLDLIIVPKAPMSETKYSSVIIEAKMKSVPTWEQLWAYNKKIGNGVKAYVEDENYHYVEIKQTQARYRVHGIDKPGWKIVDKEARKILLAPTQPVEMSDWEFMEWNSVSDDIEKGLVSGGQTPISTTVRSYQNDLEAIIKILKMADSYASCFCKTNATTKFMDFNDSIKSPFRKLRIHDLVSKYSYWCLSQVIAKDLSGVNVEVHFSRSDPILHIWKPLVNPNTENSEYKIGVQIQGTQYRHFIESKTVDSKLQQFIDDNGFIANWFRKLNLGVEKAGELNKYDANKFLYSKIDVSDKTFEELAARLTESFMDCDNAIKQNP